jgi:hypothetical protein
MAIYAAGRVKIAAELKSATIARFLGSVPKVPCLIVRNDYPPGTLNKF